MLLGAPGRTTRSYQALLLARNSWPGLLALILGARMLLGAPGLKELAGTTSSKELLGAPGLATRSKDATRGSWPYY